MNAAADDALWYKDAIIYQLHVKSFFDANNDGIGDFRGLIAKLGHIADLGINAIWLLPFYPSPRLDDGYDIADYCAVHPDYGTLDDLREFIGAAHARGIRVVTELVINHTSDQHAWFQRARRAPAGSVERDFYVWSDNDQRYAGTRIIFCDTEKSNWTWDPVAGAYYWHRFYAHQPDLNFDNPAVIDEVLRVMRFWLDAGVDGLRLDAVPYLVERDGTNNENLPETHAILKRVRAELDARYTNRMLLAEANQWPEDVQEYFGAGDECHMAFHFPLMPRMYMAIAREDRFPITDILRQTPVIPPNCQWAIFLRNHDELTLEMVTDAERDYLWNVYAADRRARINLGIRRRLAPLLQRDARRIALMNSLLLSMPGTPVIYYGDEIGMGDNVRLGDRHGVRTPMQWSPDRNGGFSTADPEALVLPTIMDSLYGYQAVNVEAQSRDQHSLLNWMRRMLALRRRHRAFGRGTIRFLNPGNRRILAYLREHEGDALLCVCNLARAPQAVELGLQEFAGCVPVELTGGSPFPPIGQLTYLLTLPPYGFYWLELRRDGAPPSWHDPAPEMLPEFATLVLRRAGSDVFSSAHRHVLEDESLPRYLPLRRWFAEKDVVPARAIVDDHLILDGSEPVAIAFCSTPRGNRYVLPLGIAWEDASPSILAQQLALARVRRGARMGLLTDAFVLDRFVSILFDAWRRGEPLATVAGAAVSFELRDAAALEIALETPIRWLSAEQSNSSLIIDDRLVLKLLRRAVAGTHPEAEFGRYLAAQGFERVPPFLGQACVESDNGHAVFALLQGFVRNQGDAWQWTLDTLARIGEDAFGARRSETNGDLFTEYLTFAARLGQRLGELHVALAAPTADPAFAPRMIDRDDIAAWTRAAERRLLHAADVLAHAHADAPPAWLVDLDVARGALAQRFEEALGTDGTRIHGDFHLGQVLVAAGDAWLIDFEGDPALPLEQRRVKTCPLRDLAGLLRSIDYAAGSATTALHGHLSGREREITLFFATFRSRAIAAVIENYDAAITAAPALPSPTRHAALLQAFVLERAAHDVGYEAASRPGWLWLAERGLRDALHGLNA